MSRPKKSLQGNLTIVNQLKDDALLLVRKRVTEICRASSRDEGCTCSDMLSGIFVDAIKALTTNFDDEHSEIDLYDWLSQVYEHLLLYAVDAENGSDCTVNLISKSKKRYGNFYTPRDLATFTVENALRELVYYADGKLLGAEQILNLKIVDASMGSGIFLSAALEIPVPTPNGDWSGIRFGAV